jgi:hypothetical protein
MHWLDSLSAPRFRSQALFQAFRRITPCANAKQASNGPKIETSSQLLNYLSLAVLVGLAVLCFLHYRLDRRLEKNAKDSENGE